MMSFCRMGEALFQSHLRHIHPVHMDHLYEQAQFQEFQSHLRHIHPVHGNSRDFLDVPMIVSIASAPHPPCPPGTVRVDVCNKADVFQSHLRHIHPVHQIRFWYCNGSLFVSIASAPHPPCPRVCYVVSRYIGNSFNRICATSTLSTPLCELAALY